jgi:WD40 repeat protein
MRLQGDISTVRLWDAENGDELALLKGHTGGKRVWVSWSPDGGLLASVGGDGTVIIWGP